MQATPLSSLSQKRSLLHIAPDPRSKWPAPAYTTCKLFTDLTFRFSPRVSKKMAVSADVRFCLSAASAGQLHGARGLGGRRYCSRLGKFGNGELMGSKLKLNQLHRGTGPATRIPMQQVCMSLTTDVAVETKLRDLEMERRDPRTVVAVILGGGAGTRLFPLTKRRAKPAVPIGGAYRLIDVPMSNCINSGINKVYILTQYNSASLNRHLARAYNFGNGVNFGDGFVEALAATQTPGEAGKKWFQGTADAVRQFHWLFEGPRSKEIEDVLILSGDHLYRMDYMDFVQNHRQGGADITLSCLPMDDSRASDFGLMKIDNKGRVLSFSEKPKGVDLKAMQVDTTVLGLSKEEALKKPYIASMGVYVFKKEILLNLLRWRFPTANDFGSEIIPASAKEFYIKAYLFNDYWEDIGTIRSFFEANLALTEHPPRFSFYDATKPMYTSRRNLPPSKIDNSKIVDSIISHGSFLDNCFIEHSVIGIRSRINSNAHLQDTVMLGADFYETEAEVASVVAEGRVPVGIGENTKIKECIIDKNARIGKNVVIANSEGVQEADRSMEGFYIRSGVTVILKNSFIQDGTVI
ncbi:ADP-glucose pyrophosphorylase family protein [Salix suchowensis]|nr:ADP-glucose pyrophosphorylase family protein [Salix suchowensis]